MATELVRPEYVNRFVRAWLDNNTPRGKEDVFDILPEMTPGEAYTALVKLGYNTNHELHVAVRRGAMNLAGKPREP